jgi:hypothetical protein
VQETLSKHQRDLHIVTVRCCRPCLGDRTSLASGLLRNR